VSTLNVLKSITVECMEILESFGWIALGSYCILEIAWKLEEVVKNKLKYKSEQEKAIDDADFGEVQLTIGDAVITEKGIINADNLIRLIQVEQRLQTCVGSNSPSTNTDTEAARPSGRIGFGYKIDCLARNT
jgi:hypothetical protein